MIAIAALFLALCSGSVFASVFRSRFEPALTISVRGSCGCQRSVFHFHNLLFRNTITQ